MGTRSGDVDPALVHLIAIKEGLSPHEVEALLNTQSGLLGISGLTNDMKVLEEELRENDDRRVLLAIEVFCYRARKYIGAFLAAMGGADAVVFTGGIGEHSADPRPHLRWPRVGGPDNRSESEPADSRARGPRQPRRIEATRLGHSDERGTADCARHCALCSGSAAPVVAARATGLGRRCSICRRRRDGIFRSVRFPGLSAHPGNGQSNANANLRRRSLRK